MQVSQPVGALAIEAVVADGLEEAPVVHGVLPDLGLAQLVGGVHHEGPQPLHAAEPTRLLHRRQQLADGVAVVALVGVGLEVAAAGDGRHPRLAAEAVAARAVGPAEFEHQVDPLLQQRRHAVPVEGVLQDHDVVCEEQLLFAGHVDVAVGVGLVEVVEAAAGQIGHRFGEDATRARAAQRRVGEDDEDGAGHEGSFRFQNMLASVAVPATSTTGGVNEPMTVPAIQTTDLTRFYGRHRGIEAVDLVVEQGEVFGFLGPNGAGKTTTIRLLLDLIRPTRGAARVLGLDCHRRGLAGPPPDRLPARRVPFLREPHRTPDARLPR